MGVPGEGSYTPWERLATALDVGGEEGEATSYGIEISVDILATGMRQYVYERDAQEQQQGRSLMPNYKDPDWILGKRFTADFVVCSITEGDPQIVKLLMPELGETLTLYRFELERIITSGVIVEGEQKTLPAELAGRRVPGTS